MDTLLKQGTIWLQHFHIVKGLKVLNNLLNQRYEATMYRPAQPIYEFTTEEHGDIEYLYSFEFDRSMPKNVKVIVESCASWEDRKQLINTEFSITPQNVEKHLKLIIDEHKKQLDRTLEKSHNV